MRVEVFVIDLFISQILLGLEYLHFNSIAHRFELYFGWISSSHFFLDRDLKPENILVSSTGIIKLTDFGGSADFSSASTASKKNGFVDDTQGTWAFWAPEICASDDLSTYSAFQSDVWAAGVVLFVMLYGILPFWDDDTGTLFQLIETRMLHPDVPLPLPEENKSLRSDLAYEMIEGVLIGKPENRPSIRQCQSRAWVQSNAFPSDPSSNDYRSRMMRMVSNQKSVADLSDEELSLESAITPGKAMYISKLAFKKVVKKSTESLQKFVAVMASLDENDEEKMRSQDTNEEDGADADSEKVMTDKGNSYRNLLKVFSKGSNEALTTPATPAAPTPFDAVMTSNPLKGNEYLDEMSKDVVSDSDSDSSSDDDWTAWTRDFLEAPQELYRRLTSDPAPVILLSRSSSISSDLNSFQRNSHQWNLVTFRFPKKCSYCKTTIWPSFQLSAENNVFQCQFCAKIYHQKCCYDEEEFCLEGSTTVR